MKTKKLKGKLNLKKNKVSNLDQSKVSGGWHDASKGICGGWTISIDEACTISEGGGSECHCL